MKPRHTTGQEYRIGAIPGTQPGTVRTDGEAEVDAKRERRERMREARGRVKRTRRSDYKPARVDDPIAAPAIPEWDNPYRKQKMDRGTALHLSALRKSRELAASDPANPVDRAAIIRRDDKTCWICKRRLNVREIHLDHVIPLSRGGKHIPENLKVCCKPCNAWKGDRLVTPVLDA